MATPLAEPTAIPIGMEEEDYDVELAHNIPQADATPVPDGAFVESLPVVVAALTRTAVNATADTGTLPANHNRNADENIPTALATPITRSSPTVRVVARYPERPLNIRQSSPPVQPPGVDLSCCVSCCSWDRWIQKCYCLWFLTLIVIGSIMTKLLLSAPNY